MKLTPCVAFNAIIAGLAVENGLTASFIIIQISLLVVLTLNNPLNHDSLLMLTVSLIITPPINYGMSPTLFQRQLIGVVRDKQ